MKKVISIILSAAIILSCFVPSFASAEQAKADCVPLILVRGMNFGGLYLNYGEKDEENVLGEINAGEIVKTVFKALALWAFKGGDAAVQAIIDYAKPLFEHYSCNNRGESVYDVSMATYPLSLANYPDAGFEKGTVNEEGILHSSIEHYGAENTYYVNYDWRMNPRDIADVINETVNRAIAASGKDKVNIVCASMGGVMTLAYLDEYGCEKLNKCVFLSSTFFGTHVTTDLFQGKLDVAPDTLANFAYANLGGNKAVKALITVLDKAGVIKLLSNLANTFIARNKETVYEQVLMPCFGTMLSFWAVTQPEAIDSCIDYMFGDNKSEYAELIEKIYDLRSMMQNKKNILTSAATQGLDISVVATYDSPLIPIYENADANGDATLETEYMSGGAVVASYGKTLGSSYVSSNPKYLSPDNVVDASTCVLPDNTWIIRGAPHVSCSYGTDYSDFLFWLLDFDGCATVNSNAKYPQFMLSGKDQSLSTFK